MGLGQKNALLTPRYLLLRASGKIGRMVLQKLKLCSSISKKRLIQYFIQYFLDKLNNLGLRCQMQNFLKCFLSKRQQWVNSGNVYSNFAEVDFGVPQGSVLGPLLFLVYIKDIDNDCSQNCWTVYAEDTVVEQKAKSTIEVFSQYLHLFSDYLIKNKLNVNYE